MHACHRVVAPFLLALTAACAKPVVETAPVRMPVEVAAPVANTWDAAIAVMRTAGAEIASADTATGLIMLETMLGGVALAQYADCGRSGESRIYPDVADVELHVQGDSTRSTIQVIVKWQHFSQAAQQWNQCRTSGEFEDATEQMIRQRAELSARRSR